MRVFITEAWHRSARSVPRTKHILFSVLALIAFLCTNTTARSSLSGQVAGTVVDQSGASVGGAWVVLFGAAGLEAQRSLTDQRGHFTLDRVIAADYVVAVQKNGFRELRRVLHVVPGETVQLQFQLNDLSAGLSTTISGGSSTWGFVAAATGHRTQDLRTGGGLDSHSVVTRLLGISSKFRGDRLQDTAYGQYNANAKFQYKSSDADVLSIEYLRGTQLGLRR
jgi:hypothetical protein